MGNVSANAEVAHLLAPAAVGGLETVVRSLVAAQRACGAPARVVSVIDGPASDPFLTALRQRGIPVQTIPGQGRAYWREARLVAAALETTTRPIVHTHGYRADVIGRWVAGRLGCPLVSTVHGFTGGDRKNRLYEWVQVRALRGFGRVVAVSASVAERLATSGVPASRLTTIQNAHAFRTDLLSRREGRAALGLPADGPVIGFVGRLAPEKDLAMLIRAVGGLARPVVLAIVGEGPARASLESLAATVLGPGRVAWCEGVIDAARVFPAFDCFAISSKTEGTPMVLFEAAAAGVPIVTTAVGGIPDVVSEREAWLVPPEVPAPMTRAFEEVFGRPDEAARRAELARERVKRDFGVERWVAQYEAVYREVGR